MFSVRRLSSASRLVVGVFRPGTGRDSAVPVMYMKMLFADRKSLIDASLLYSFQQALLGTSEISPSCKNVIYSYRGDV